IMIVFFFQAEDGIRDKLVTGVQTCALPILTLVQSAALHPHLPTTPPATRTKGQEREVPPLVEGACNPGEENPYRGQPRNQDRRHTCLHRCRGFARPRLLLSDWRSSQSGRLCRSPQPLG